MNAPKVETSSGRVASKRRRRLAWAGGTVLAIIVLFLLVVFVLPSPMARYVIADQLEQLGIKHEGIDTVKIDLWDSEVTAGPIAFRSQDARQGEITEAGFRYSFKHLFETRAFISLFFLRGVNLEIKRHENGSITFNGVGLEQALGGKGEEGAADQVAEGEEDAGFGAGINRFEFTDSQLVFEDYTGGSLTFDIKRLVLSDFLTWDPQKPGSFELDGAVNGIGLEWNGTARPFAEPKTVTLNSRIHEATIDKFAIFAGPTGLQRQDGTIETDVRYDYVLHASGLIEGSMDGTYSLSQLDIATEAGGTVALETASMSINFSQRIETDGSMTLTGAFDLKTSPLSLGAANGGAMNLGEISFAIEDLNFKKSAETREIGPRLAALESEIEQPETTPTVIGLFISTVRDVARNALHHQLELDGKPSLTVKGGTFDLATGEGAPSLKASFESLAANLGMVDSRTLNKGWSTTAALDVAIDDLQASTEDIEANTVKVQVLSKAIELKRQDLETTFAFDLATKLQDISARLGPTGEVALSALGFGTAGMTIAGKDGSGRLSGPVALSLEGLKGALKTEDSEIALQGSAVRIEFPEFSLEGDDALTAALTGMVQAEDLKMDQGGKAPLSLGFRTAGLKLEGIRIEPLTTQAGIEGGVASSLTDLTVKFGAPESEMALDVSKIDAKLDKFGIQMSDQTSMNLAGEIIFGSLEGSLPLAGDDRAMAKVSETRVSLSDLKVKGSDVAALADVGTGKISVRTSGQAPQTVDIDTLRIDGINADPSKAFEIGTIALDGLRVGVNETIASLGGETSDKKATEQASVPARIGMISISSGSSVEFTDSSVDPPMKMEILIEKAEVGPIDTGAPETKTAIDLGLKTDSGAAVKVDGWASPLRPTPDFELTTAVQKLPLPPFSPYAGSVVGMYVDSGSLSVDAEAAANSGDLKGNIKVLIDDLYLEPLSDEDSKSFEDDFGVPINFAVGILKNDQGQIDLGFPVAGTVEAPEVDYSEAISKAIAGAAASILPTNWFGDDGRSFEIQPVIFVPGTADITEEGASSADRIGELLNGKPQLTIRLCGKAAAADLVVLRGGDPSVESTGEDLAVDANEGQGATEPEPIAKPTEEEANKLLALAEERRKTVQQYLIASYGIDVAKIFECRNSYSTEGSKPPRAEFRL